jgi:hypothetical protein
MFQMSGILMEKGRKIGADSRIVVLEQIELHAMRNATQREP